MAALDLGSVPDLIQALLAVGGAGAGVFAWRKKRKSDEAKSHLEQDNLELEREKIQLEKEKAALAVQAERAAEAERAASQQRQNDLAYANAWALKAEVDHAAGLAVRFLGDEIAIEALPEEAAPLGSWQANRALFAEVLLPEDWRRLVRAVEGFQAQSNRFLAVVNRVGPFTADEKRKLIDDLKETGERLIGDHGVVETALRPLFDLTGEVRPGSGKSASSDS